VIEGLAPRVDDPIALADPMAPDRRLSAFAMQHVDWQRAGFLKVQAMSSRTGDEQAPVPTVGISWAQVAERYRRRCR
jgi:hypothetical protein